MGEVAVEVKPPDDVEADVLALPAREDGGGAFAHRTPLLDERLTRLLQRLAEDGELRGELGKTLVLHADGDGKARRVAAAGIGRIGELDSDALRTAAASVARATEEVGGTLAWMLDDTLPLPLDEQARAVVEGVLLGSYRPGRWKTGAEEPRPLERIVLCAADDGPLAEVAAQAARVSRWVSWARDLANSPPNELTPAGLATQAAALELANLRTEALDPKRIDELGMGALSAVGRASANGPRLVVLYYEPSQPARTDLTLGLVGKAITFDAGGISLKPALKMEDMKGDMAGGAAVLAGTAAIADLGLPIRVVTVLAAAENLVSGESFRPGDILRAANGKTIEITNTDAEGRLVLADALWYSRGEGATHILDIATLTGAMEFALGDLYGGLFANDDAWRDELLAAGKRSGDHVWPFPLHRRYRRYVDSDYADMKNSSDLQQASPALAAEFLREFSGEGPWAHLDMSGPGFLERSRGDYLTQRGGTGYGVRLIVELARALTR
ncbi:MAG: leucyl aminopeptidase [Actinobacteria bacterium]|nr:MAG: leucyl aminopeptidase [Actinomycetota bacterium]